MLPNIFTLSEAIKVEDQMHQFLVRFVVVERNDRDAIVQLVAERIHCIVYDDHVFQVSIRNDSEVFNIYSLLCSNTVISIEPILYQLTSRV